MIGVAIIVNVDHDAEVQTVGLARAQGGAFEVLEHGMGRAALAMDAMASMMPLNAYILPY